MHNVLAGTKRKFNLIFVNKKDVILCKLSGKEMLTTTYFASWSTEKIVAIFLPVWKQGERGGGSREKVIAPGYAMNYLTRRF